MRLDNRRVATDSVRDLIDSLRTRVQAELDERLTALTSQHDEAVAAARREAEAQAEQRWTARLAEREMAANQAVSAQSELRAEQAALRNALGLLDAATSLSDLLSTIWTSATGIGLDASLFVGPELDPWNGASGAGGADAQPMRMVAEAARDRRNVTRSQDSVAVPLLLEGVPVAVLCAPVPAGSASDILELIARYGAARLGALTALRTAQAQRWLSPPPATPDSSSTSQGKTHEERGPGGEQDGVQSARRYARLLVSEIKLYNETAVNEGRAHRDITRRLGAEIDRARRLYEERVPAAVADRGHHFHQELVQTLAGGDPSLLG